MYPSTHKLSNFCYCTGEAVYHSSVGSDSPTSVFAESFFSEDAYEIRVCRTGVKEQWEMVLLG